MGKVTIVIAIVMAALLVTAQNWTAPTRIASYSRDARLTERFTRIDADTLRYEATVDDPRTWTRSWTVAFPLKRDPSYELFEYACHEENYSMPHMLRGARVVEN